MTIIVHVMCPSCDHEFHHHAEVAVCNTCSKEFDLANQGGAYCSRKCQVDAYHERRLAKARAATIERQRQRGEIPNGSK